MKWISVKDRMPEKGQMIIYAMGIELFASVGRYCGKETPMPSSPPWLSWKDVTHWMPLPEISNEED